VVVYAKILEIKFNLGKMKEKIPRKKSIDEQVKDLKKTTIRAGVILLLTLASDHLPIKVMKTTIFEPLLPNTSTAENSDSLKLNKSLREKKQHSQELSLFISDLKESESLSQAKFEFPEAHERGDYSFTAKDFVDDDQLVIVTTEIAIINQFLPETQKMKNVKVVGSIQQKGLAAGLFVEAVVFGDTVYARHGTLIHEMSHILSQGLVRDKYELESKDGYEALFNIFVGKNRIVSTEDLKKIGLRDYALDSSNCEIYATASQILAENYSELTPEKKQTYNKVLAFAATKQSVFGTEQFKKILMDYHHAISTDNFEYIKNQTKHDILQLHKMVNAHEQLKTDPTVQKYVHQLELMRLKINTLNGIKIYLPVFLFFVMLNSVMEITVKTVTTGDAAEKLTN
jgi:hypothetical protein